MRSERAYRGLLRLYPAAFRLRYRDEMVRLFADQLRDARAADGTRGIVATWFRTLADLARTAALEHLRTDRAVAQSLAIFQPSRWMRLLGILAVVGGVILVWGWVDWNPFAIGNNNAVRLILFWLGGLSIALAFHQRQSALAPVWASVVTASVAGIGAWNIAMILLAIDRESPFSDTFGLIGFIASFLGWLAASAYGIATLVIGAAWRDMTPALATITRLAAAILVVAGPVATFGMDRLGLTRSEPYGALFETLGALGVTGVGIAWLLLGGVLVAGRGRRQPA